MNLCINPDCDRAENSQEKLFCQACGSELLIAGQYRVIKRLSKKGGFGRTYEILDEDNIIKVLKVLIKDHPQVIDLFQREAEILSQLNCAGIPKGEGYFTYLPKNRQTPLHCLVMEKIEGMDLEEYQKQRSNLPIDRIIAFKWLKQLTEILHELHSYNLFHRDIKPSNIILRPDGHLALIDFGAVRQVTATIVAGERSTEIYTPGYAAPEQEKGYALPQSDFYALGRTFVYLLTGKFPTDISIYDRYNNELKWRQYTPDLDPDFANLIARLMEEKANKRPSNTSEILKIISQIEPKITNKKVKINLTKQENKLLNQLSEIDPAQKIIKNLDSGVKTVIDPNFGGFPAIQNTKHNRENLQNQNSSKQIKLAIISGLIIAGLGTIIGYQTIQGNRADGRQPNQTEEAITPKPENQARSEWFSSGERVLLKGRGNRFRDLGVAAFKEQEYVKAKDFFQKGIKSNRNDPEVQIYFNNAKARLLGSPLLIAAVVPIDSRQTSSQEILRGIADAQNKINQAGGINGRLVEIVIANDGNDPEKARIIAAEIAQNQQILGAIGHNSSNATKAALREYEKAGIAVISPTSSSTDLKAEVFFRTILSDSESGKKLAQYTKNSLKIDNVAIFYNSNSNYSKSLLEAFEENFNKSGGEIELAIDISDPNLDPETEIKALRGKVEAIALFPNTETTSVAISLARANLELPGQKFQLLGGDALYSSDTLTSGGRAVEGLTIAVPWFSRDQAYAKAAAERWLGTVNWRTATSYDATIAMLSALTERPTRQSAIENLRYNTKIPPEETSGDLLQFSLSGERQGSPVLVKISRDTSSRPTGAVFGFKLIQE